MFIEIKLSERKECCRKAYIEGLVYGLKMKNIKVSKDILEMLEIAKGVKHD